MNGHTGGQSSDWRNSCLCKGGQVHFDSDQNQSELGYENIEESVDINMNIFFETTIPSLHLTSPLLNPRRLCEKDERRSTNLCEKLWLIPIMRIFISSLALSVYELYFVNWSNFLYEGDRLIINWVSVVYEVRVCLRETSYFPRNPCWKEVMLMQSRFSNSCSHSGPDCILQWFVSQLKKKKMGM